MMKVIIRGSWASYVGTDYCEALGIYDSVADAEEDAADYAWDRFEDDEEDYDEDGTYCGEGPDYYIEEYDPAKHDCKRAGGGSFASDFEPIEPETFARRKINLADDH